MHPTARRQGLTLTEGPEGLLVTDDASGATHVLHPITALVFARANGQVSVASLAALLRDDLRVEADNETVFAALDALADAGLLEGRVAPPAGARRYGRRELARTVAIAAAGATLAAVARSGPAFAETEQEMKQKAQEQAKKQQELQKAQEEKRKADIDLQKQQEQKAKQLDKDFQEARKIAEQNAKKKGPADAQKESAQKKKEDKEGVSDAFKQAFVEEQKEKNKK